MILGIDASTRCIGWCTITPEGKVLEIGHLDLSKKKSLYEKLDAFQEFLCGFLPHGFEVFVEAPLPRSNNQNVVNLLQRWNGMCCAALYQYFNHREPTLIEQRSALKSLGIKVPKGVKGKERKKYILQHVLDLGIIPEDEVKYKKTGNFQDFMFDMADAYVVAAAGLNIDGL